MIPKVSIVVPVYKVEKYLDRCIKSIINQTFTQIEIILVDDGSPDKCGEICDKYSEIDRRVRVIHKKNNGLSEARNSGFDVAKGKYICFIDSDDWIEKEYIEKLYSKCENDNSDIGMCGFFINYEEENYFQVINCDKEYSLIGRESFNNNLLKVIKEIGFTVVWNKLYKISFLKENNIRFSKASLIAEDLVYNCEFLSAVNSISVVNEPLYHYIRYDGTILSKYQANYYKNDITKLRYNVIKSMMSTLELISSEEKEKIADGYYLAGIYDSIYNLYRSDCTLSLLEKKKILREYILDDSYGKKLVEKSKEKNCLNRILKLSYKLNNATIMATIYLVLFSIRYNCSKLYKKTRKKGI